MNQINTGLISFGEFELDITRRKLSRDGNPVSLNSRTFELLFALVERRGEILSKDELLDTVWEGQFVEEGNLTVHISTLRRILGEKKDDHRFIMTVPGRGYSFVADVDYGNADEFVIESHSLSQIVVEEEIKDTLGPETTDIPALGPRPSRLPDLLRNWPRALLAVFVAALLLAAGGYFIRQRVVGRNAPVIFQQMSIRRLTTTGHVGNAAFSPDGKLFVYAITEGSEESLWLGHVDGGKPVQLLPAVGRVYLNFEFSPDDSSLYYTVSDNFDNGTLYKMPVFGGTPEKIHDNFRGLTFAPDGKRFAFLRWNPEQHVTVLMIADSSGENEREIEIKPAGNERPRWNGISWSPDGAAIAAAGTIGVDDASLYLIDISSGSARRLTEKSWRKIEAPSWMHDGSGMVAVGIERNTIPPQLWLISVPGGDVRRLSNDLNDWGYRVSFANDNSLLAIQGISESNIWTAPANNLRESQQITFSSAGRKDGWNTLVWMPDGRVIYTADTHDGSTILMMNEDGSMEKQLIPDGGLNSYPSLTADGRTMVFQSNRSGHFAVWRSDIDGTNMVQLTGDETAGQPFISPDGKWVIYDSNIDGRGELRRMPANGGEGRLLTDKPAGWAQISADSKFVACETDIDGKDKVAILTIETGELVGSFDIPRLANLRLGIHWTPDGKAITYRDWANGIWRQSIDGGEPRRLDGLPEEKLFSYGWSADGRSFAFARGKTSRDIVLITDAH